MNNTYGAVIVGRNDNYGGNLLERSAYAINSCIETYDEVIFVDYNSRDKTLIETILDNLLHKNKLRCIIVTNDHHKKFTSHFENPQPCSEVLGRNIGLRRLKTDFLVSTNVDEINPPRSFIEQITNKNLMVTVARRGLSLDLIKSLGSPKEINIIREKLLSMKFPQAWPMKMTEFDEWSLIGWCGDLQIAHKDIWYTVRGYEEWQLGVGVHDSYIQRKVMESGFTVEVRYDIPLWHIDHTKENDYGEYGAANAFDCLGKEYFGIKNTENWGFPDIQFEEFTI